MLCGLALVPNEITKKDIVNFRQENSHLISGPELGLNINIPHLSIVQCPFNPEILTKSVAERILQEFGTNKFNQGCFTHLAYQPDAWIFANVVHDFQLDELQNAAMKVLEPKINIQEINLDKDFSGYSKRQVAYYARYGYRYLREEFTPHITLGRTVNNNDFVAPELVKNFAVTLAGINFSYDRLAFYRAGDSGVFAEELASVSIH